MKPGRSLAGLFAILPAIMLLTVLLPRLVSWFIPEKELVLYHSGLGEPLIDLLLPSARSAGIRVKPVMANPGEAPTERQALGIAYLSSIQSPYSNESLSETESEFWKRLSSAGYPLVVEPSLFHPPAGTALSSRLSDLCGVSATGWIARYERDSEEGIPHLRLLHSDGREVILRADVHFSGKPPLARDRGRTAPVYNWFYFLVPENVENVSLARQNEIRPLPGGSIELGLTEAGKAELDKIGLPAVPPAYIERRSPFASTIAFAVNVSLLPLDLEPQDFSFGAFFRSMLSSFRTGSDNAVFWRVYLPILKRFMTESASQAPEPGKPASVPVSYRAYGKSLHRLESNGSWEPFIVKGVNIGPALPGKGFTEFPVDEYLYYDWFASISNMNLNAVRVYTLLPPAFYRAFKAWNLEHPDQELLLLQEIWPEEHPRDNNYLGSEYTENYLREIKWTIDAIHGNADIPPRDFRSDGLYTDDVSEWTLAFLIGREMEPAEVLATDRINSGYTYSGRWFSSSQSGASPTESWLALCCDFAAGYEIDRWGTQRPLSVVSWPTLDAISHWVEWRAPAIVGSVPFNDAASVDINRIDVSPLFAAGFFGSYHIYPNYPDFMNTTPWYAKYRDEQGPFLYGGYLREFMRAHYRYPALIAEYGISTSRETAHISPDGYNHGGVSEEKQGEYIVRMTRAALSEGYAGTVIFEWIDEWAKKTWTTEPFTIPFQRNPLWHNRQDPEQNYGIVSAESAGVYGYNPTAGGRFITNLAIQGTESSLDLTFRADPVNLSSRKVLIGIDTYKRSAGLRSFSDLPRERTNEMKPSGFEFMVEITFDPSGKARGARLLAADSYSVDLNRFSSTTTDTGTFRSVRVQVNGASVDNLGRYSPPLYTDFSDISDCVERFEEGLRVRIPWGLLNVTDPSSGMVLDDGGTYTQWPAQDTLSVTKSESIIAQGALVSPDNAIVDFFPRTGDGRFSDAWAYQWVSWETPAWRLREKKSTPVLRDFFGTY